MAELVPIQYHVKFLTIKLTAWLFILSVGVPVLLGPAHLTVKSKLMRAKQKHQPGLALPDMQKSEKHYFHQKKKSDSDIFSMSCN